MRLSTYEKPHGASPPPDETIVRLREALGRDFRRTDLDDRSGGSLPPVVSPGIEVRDPQDLGERENWLCTGNCAQDSGLGGPIGKSRTIELETVGSEYRRKNSCNGRGACFCRSTYSR
jgi:hypothetical protein